MLCSRGNTSTTRPSSRSSAANGLNLPLKHTCSVRALVRLRARGQSQEEPEAHCYQQEVIKFITSDGVVQIPGREILVDKPAVPKLKQPLPTWEEQSICIGASFTVAATNGLDPSRRVNFVGFCQSIDVLHECVEDVVRSRGGDILAEERDLKSGVHETLSLIVAIPYLWGVPPQLDALSSAIKYGGGIVDRVYKQWGMYRLPVSQPVYSYAKIDSRELL